MKMLINGQRIEKAEKIEVRNPYNNEVVDTVPAGDKNDVLNAIASAVEGFEISKQMHVHQRTEILNYIKNFIIVKMPANPDNKTLNLFHWLISCLLLLKTLELGKTSQFENNYVIIKELFLYLLVNF